MKILKRLLVLALAGVMVAGTTACDSNSGDTKGENKNYDLVVKYYSGAYGDDWIKLAAEEFGKEKGVNVQVVPSSDMDCGAENNLTANKNLADVYIGSSNRWQSWVQNGYIENLKSVFETTVKTSSGDKKIADYIDSEVIGRCYIERQVGSFTADDPWLEYDKEMDKTYVMAYAVIPEEYTEVIIKLPKILKNQEKKD